MSKVRNLFTNWRVIILLVALVLAVVAIHPAPFNEGVAIRTVLKNSSAQIAGVSVEKANAAPTSRERIISFNNVKIADVDDYNRVLQTLEPSKSYTMVTNKKAYLLTTKPLIEIIELDEWETVEINETIVIDEEINGTMVSVPTQVTRSIERRKTQQNVIGMEDIGLRVENAPKTNLRKGLDLQGGTRVLLQPEEEVSEEDMDTILASMSERLNVYGLSDVTVRKASDLSGGQFIVVEIAGANEEEVKDLLARQGKFEAKVGNETVFIGGNRDVTYVCRSADCSGIDLLQGGCFAQGDGTTACRFFFTITLSPEAAKRQADATAVLQVITFDPLTGQPMQRGNQYLSEKLQLLLDDQVVDELSIGADLKGKAVTNIQISGSGVGSTQLAARDDALKNMRRLQTIMLTGSLPVKLNVVKTDTISASLGQEFLRNALLLGVISIILVSLIILLRYRKIKLAIPILITSFSELVLILGLASIIGWNLDLAAIAGIIIAIGTSVDHQIVITDQTLAKEQHATSWRQRMKGAFYIILIAYLTTSSAMFPLLIAGAGLLKGLALTTIAGITMGVLVTRPAYGHIIEILLRDE